MRKVGNTWIPDVDPHFEVVFAASDIFTPQDLLEGLKHVTEWDCAIDGGAHVGSWTRYLARGFSHVWAFEPQVENYQCLCANVAGLENVETRRTALGERWRAFVGMEPGSTTGGWHISEGNGVCMMPLDELRPLDKRKVGYLKLDVEGYEWYSLMGAKNLVERCNPVVQVEQKGHEKRYDTPTARTLLNSWGYREVGQSGRDVIFKRD